MNGTAHADTPGMPSVLGVAVLLAQASAVPAESASVQFHGFVDVFYGLNTNRPFDGTSFVPGTGTTARRANEFNLNAAAVDVSLQPRPVGFHLTLAVGSGPDVVHASEPGKLVDVTTTGAAAPVRAAVAYAMMLIRLM